MGISQIRATISSHSRVVFAFWGKAQSSYAPFSASAEFQWTSLSRVPNYSSEYSLQVLGKAFEVITHLVTTSAINKKDAFTAMGGLVEKMADIKLKGLAGEALFAISEALGPQFTIVQLHKKATAHKNPKARPSDESAKLHNCRRRRNPSFSISLDSPVY